MTLNKFIGAVDGSGLKYLQQVDTILSNLIHVVAVPLTPNFFETLKDGLLTLFSVFITEKFVLVGCILAVVFFIVGLLAFKMRYAPSVFHIVIYGFWIIFVLSCVWNFKSMFEEAKAKNYARMMQTQDVPPDCEFDRMGTIYTVWYYFRVHLLKCKKEMTLFFYS